MRYRKTAITVKLRTRGESLKLLHDPDGISGDVITIEHFARNGNLLGKLSLTWHAATTIQQFLNGIEAKQSRLCS